MKKILLICAIISTMLLSSCGFSYQATSNENQHQTSVVLSEANFKVIGTVTGESSQTYVLGIGGMSKKSLEQSAMINMYQNANLTGSQAIVNVNVFYRSEFYILWSKTRAVATGTIIEFKR